MTETETVYAILRELKRLLTNRKDDFELKVIERPARVYFNLKASIDDTPKLVGKQGLHVNAIKLLVSEFGKNFGKAHEFNLLDPDPGDVASVQPSKPVDNYDPKPLVDLLELILGAVGVGSWRVVVEERGINGHGALVFHFGVCVGSADDYALLTIAPNLDSPLTVVAAIGTLLRAAASVAGIRVDVSVVKP